MTTILAAITTSIDGFYAGRNDRPGLGMGEGAERLHNWMFGGRWAADAQATGVDRELLDERRARTGAVIGGRTTFDNAEAWGGSNPYPVPFFIVTHRPDDQPPGGAFTFVGSLEAAIERARAAAGDRDVVIMGGGTLIREALRAGVVDEFIHSMAPFVLGGGKRLFEGIDRSVDMEPIRTVASPLATHVVYRVLAPA
jgi:dihydrofolate reductase